MTTIPTFTTKGFTIEIIADECKKEACKCYVNYDEKFSMKINNNTPLLTNMIIYQNNHHIASWYINSHESIIITRSMLKRKPFALTKITKFNIHFKNTKYEAKIEFYIIPYIKNTPNLLKNVISDERQYDDFFYFPSLLQY